MSFTPDIPTAIEEIVQSALERVHTALPAKVDSYDASKQEVAAQPLIKRTVEDEEGNVTKVDLPIIPGIPVVFPGAGSYKITWPIAKGDIVLLVFSEVSLDQWLQLGGTVDPLDDRRFDMSDAVAIPGLLPFKSPTSDVDASSMVLGAPNIKLGSKDADDPVVRQSDLEALKTWLDAHVHTGVTTGAGTSGAPNPLDLSPTVTGSDKLKAD